MKYKLETKEDIIAYLYFGYLPKATEYKLLKQICEAIDKYSFSSLKEEEISKLTYKFWDEGIIKGLENSEGKQIVLPLSGGFDSRFILGGLLKHISPNEIVAFTYGVPGSYNFEISKKIAQHTGIDHYLFDLNQVIFDEVELRSYIDLIDRPVPLFHSYLHYYPFKQFGQDKLFWSGVYGGEIISQYLNIDSNDEIEKQFVNKKKIGTSKITGIDYTSFLPDIPLELKNKIHYSDTLNFASRQEAYITPVNLFNKYSFVTPFSYEKFISLLFQIDRSYRVEARLAKSIAHQYYPELFKIPLDKKGGLPINPSIFDVIKKYFKLGIGNYIFPYFGLEKKYKNINAVEFDKIYKENNLFSKMIDDKNEEFLTDPRMRYFDLKNNTHNTYDLLSRSSACILMQYQSKIER